MNLTALKQSTNIRSTIKYLLVILAISFVPYILVLNEIKLSFSTVYLHISELQSIDSRSKYLTSMFFHLLLELNTIIINFLTFILCLLYFRLKNNYVAFLLAFLAITNALSEFILILYTTNIISTTASNIQITTFFWHLSQLQSIIYTLLGVLILYFKDIFSTIKKRHTSILLLILIILHTVSTQYFINISVASLAAINTFISNLTPALLFLTVNSLLAGGFLFSYFNYSTNKLFLIMTYSLVFKISAIFYMSSSLSTLYNNYFNSAYVLNFFSTLVPLIYLLLDYMRNHLLISNSKNRLNKLNAEFVTTNKELNQFVYSVSHDLQTPIRHIGIYISLYADKHKNTSDIELQKWFMYIKNASTKMNTLLNDLLSYSRASRNNNPIVTLNLSEIAKRILYAYQKNYKDLEFIFTINTTTDITACYEKMSILLDQLISNAQKFRSTKNTVKVEFGSTTNSNNNNNKVFYFKDYGIGLDEKYYHKIFQIFTKLDSSKDGTGIGLALCSQIIKLYNGKIWVDSSIDNYTVFYFTVPNIDKTVEKLEV